MVYCNTYLSLGRPWNNLSRTIGRWSITFLKLRRTKLLHNYIPIGSGLLPVLFFQYIGWSFDCWLASALTRCMIPDVFIILITFLSHWNIQLLAFSSSLITAKWLWPAVFFFLLCFLTLIFHSLKTVQAPCLHTYQPWPLGRSSLEKCIPLKFTKKKQKNKQLNN